ncbi:MAG: hypothetical protein EXR72_00585 [Myxococcales bacterium]|nr:hypothetical protein [Myxococcales bacterium]
MSPEARYARGGRAVHAAFRLAAALLALPAVAAAQHELPAGKWRAVEGGTEVCMEVLPSQQLRLSLRGPGDRNPVVVDGKYRITATKMGDFHLDFEVATIRQKTLGNCRKYWFDKELDATRQLGIELRRGARLRLTLHFECAAGREQVQLCIHIAEEGRPKVACRALQSERGTVCKEPPAIDGSLINRPPDRPRP